MWRTRKRTRFLLASILLATAAFLGVSVAFGVKLYVAQESLRLGAISGEGWRSVEFLDSKGDFLAKANLLFEQSSDGLTRMRIEIVHAGDTEVDALRFSFDPQPSCILDAWLKVPSGGPWNPIRTYQIEWTVGFDIEDLGFMGQGTFLLDLLLRPHPPECSFDFRVYLTLHNTDSVLIETRYVGRFTVPFTIVSPGEVKVSGPTTPY